MKQFIATLLIGFSLSNLAFADCDYSKIVKNPDGTYTYSRELHLCVGQMKSELEAANTQVVEYKKVIDLKDLALTKANERSDMWMNTSFKMQDRINSIESLQSKSNLLYTALGVGLTVLSVWAAGQLK